MNRIFVWPAVETGPVNSSSLVVDNAVHYSVNCNHQKNDGCD